MQLAQSKRHEHSHSICDCVCESAKSSVYNQSKYTKQGSALDKCRDIYTHTHSTNKLSFSSVHSYFTNRIESTDSCI